MPFQNGYNYKNYRMEKATVKRLAEIKRRDCKTYEELFTKLIKAYANSRQNNY